MYICNDCGSEFEDPKLERERLGEYWGAPAWETWGVCPSCGSTEIEMEDTCPMCNEHYKPNGNNFCDTCITIVSEAFQKTINDLSKEFKKEHIIEIMEDLIDEM